MAYFKRYNYSMDGCSQLRVENIQSANLRIVALAIGWQCEILKLKTICSMFVGLKSFKKIVD